MKPNPSAGIASDRLASHEAGFAPKPAQMVASKLFESLFVSTIDPFIKSVGDE
jgi:hypothetical protein